MIEFMAFFKAIAGFRSLNLLNHSFTTESFRLLDLCSA